MVDYKKETHSNKHRSPQKPGDDSNEDVEGDDDAQYTDDDDDDDDEHDGHPQVHSCATH